MGFAVAHECLLPLDQHLDPHTAAELDLDRLWSMVDDLLAAHAGH